MWRATLVVAAAAVAVTERYAQLAEEDLCRRGLVARGGPREGKLSAEGRFGDGYGANAERGRLDRGGFGDDGDAESARGKAKQDRRSRGLERDVEGDAGRFAGSFEDTSDAGAIRRVLLGSPRP